MDIIKRKRKKEKKIKKRVALFASGLICAFMLLLFIQKSHEQYSMIISLNYEIASKGLNPNNTRYNSYEIKSEEVLKDVIDRLKVTDRITVSELSDSIEIDNVSKKEDYILTDYVVRYERNPKIEDINPEIVLSTLFDSYYDYFVRNYTTNNQILAYDEPDKDNCDYLNLIDKMEVEVNQIQNYINDRMKENVSLFSDGTSESYQSLMERAENLKSVDLKNLRNEIIENGVTMDLGLMTNVMAYKNELLNIEQKTNMAAYETRMEAIDLYDSTLFPTISVPSVNNNEYYISTTKTGLDYIFEEAKQYLNASLDAQNEISSNTYIINKMTGDDKNRMDETQLDICIQQVEEKIKTLADDTKTTDNAYIEYKTRQYLSFKINKKGA